MLDSAEAPNGISDYVEGALFGVALLVILGALMGLLNWLFDHKRAIGSALIVVPILFPRIVLCCERQGAEQ